MSTVIPALSFSDSVQNASARLDAHVRAIIEWHFNPETGCPFWLEFASLCSAINPFAVESTSCQQMRNSVTSRRGLCYIGNPPNP